jgi:hypothetical protein
VGGEEKARVHHRVHRVTTENTEKRNPTAQPGMAVPQEKSKRAGLRDQRYIWEFGVKRKAPASEGGRYKKLWESGDSHEEYV